jgi:hypothetical protein
MCNRRQVLDFNQGKRVGNIRLKEPVALQREKYLMVFMANCKAPPEDCYREVYLDESY